MKSILVHVYDDPGLEARLQIALDLARAFDGYLTFLQVVSHQIILPGDLYGDFSAALMPVVQEQADALRREVEARLNVEDVRWNWLQEAGLPDSRLISHAALNDLILVGSVAPMGSEAQPSRLAGALAIHGRAPVMVTPKDARGFDVSKPAIVGWNGSPEASLALRGSLELLRKAASVTLVTVTGEEDAKRSDLPPSEGAEYLSRHGISCEMIELTASGRHPAEILLETAIHREAGHIVIGAYGHARLFETVFGGVTRRILKDPPIPLVLVH